MRLNKGWHNILAMIEKRQLYNQLAIVEITCSDCFHNYLEKNDTIFYESFKEIINSSLDNETMSGIYQQIICEVFNFEGYKNQWGFKD